MLVHKIFGEKKCMGSREHGKKEKEIKEGDKLIRWGGNTIIKEEG
jgi:hypothetical protein